MVIPNSSNKENSNFFLGCFVPLVAPTRLKMSPLLGYHHRFTLLRTTASSTMLVLTCRLFSQRSRTHLGPARSFLREEEKGVFQNVHRKPFPLRAALDIGGGGVVSLCIARVDVRAQAVQKIIYHTQLPLHLEPMRAPSASSPDSTRFVLSEASVTDVVSKMEILAGAMDRFHRQHGGVDERAAVLSWPVCLAENAVELGKRLTQQFRVEVKVLGRDFEVEWPCAARAKREVPLSLCAHHRDNGDQQTSQWSSSGGPSPLQTLMAAYASSSPGSSASQPAGESPASELPPGSRQDVEALAFLSHAAVAQCTAPHRLLVVDEDPQRGIRLLGVNTSAVEDCEEEWTDQPTSEPSALLERQEVLRRRGLSPTEPRPAAPSTRLVEHRLPISVPDAHRQCVVDVQHREASTYHLHRSSPNPVLRTEFTALRRLLHDQLVQLPEWAKRKSALGGMIVGTSFNGGLLNIAARVCQKSPISLEHLEINAEHYFCGLTDVLLSQNFPHPGTVLPSTALASALFRVLGTPRVHYVPELSNAAGLLLQGSLWAPWSADRLARLKNETFYSEVRHRTFQRPHLKDNPTAAPTAHWRQE